MNSTVHNPFAVVLYHYDNFQRSKMTSERLSRIAAKYGSKPPQLLFNEFTKKFAGVSEHVYLVDLYRILDKYDIPEDFLKYIPELRDAKRSEYNNKLDAASEAFDVELLFLTKSKLCMRDSAIAPLDNMSKVKHFVPGYIGFAPHLSKIENTAISASKHLRQQREHEAPRLPMVERIAVDSTYNRNMDGNGSAAEIYRGFPSSSAAGSGTGAGTGSGTGAGYSTGDANRSICTEANQASPLYMLYQCMMNKNRVKIAIRHGRRSVRSLISILSLIIEIHGTDYEAI